MERFLVIKNWRHSSRSYYNEIVSTHDSETDAIDKARALNESAEYGIWYSVVEQEDDTSEGR